MTSLSTLQISRWKIVSIIIDFHNLTVSHPHLCRACLCCIRLEHKSGAIFFCFFLAPSLLWDVLELATVPISPFLEPLSLFFTSFAYTGFALMHISKLNLKSVSRAQYHTLYVFSPWYAVDIILSTNHCSPFLKNLPQNLKRHNLHFVSFATSFPFSFFLSFFITSGTTVQYYGYKDFFFSL